MIEYDAAEQALKIIGAEGHLVAGNNKNPIYPADNWQFHGNQLTLDAAMTAWRKWGSAARGVGIVMRDSLVVLDFDEFKNPNLDQKQWRDDFEQKLLRYTYAERSRGGQGSHFVLRVTQNYSGRRGIELFKHYYAIDVLTGNRYCDITGYRLNDLPVASGAEVVGKYLTQLEEIYVDIGSTENKYEHGTFTVACLEELLEYVRVDPEDYNGWIEIGLALFNETSGSNEGFKLWDDWSRKFGGRKYSGSNDLAYKWNSFISGKYKYSVGSIIRRAKEGGAKVSQIRLRHKGWYEIPGLRHMKVLK